MTPYSWRDDPAVPPFPDDRALIVYDGDCVMCSSWARFVLARDRQDRFRFVAATTPLGQALYRHFGLNPAELETHIVIDGGKAWFRSDASLEVLRRLGRPWSTASALRFLPKGWRDRAYGWVARNRYRWFGRRGVCYGPEPGTEHRFLA